MSRAKDIKTPFAVYMKGKARVLVSKAIKNGILIPKPCEVCGNPKVEAHHHDYSKPLEIKWVCHSCHMKIHAPEINRTKQANRDRKASEWKLYLERVGG